MERETVTVLVSTVNLCITLKLHLPVINIINVYSNKKEKMIKIQNTMVNRTSYNQVQWPMKSGFLIWPYISRLILKNIWLEGSKMIKRQISVKTIRLSNMNLKPRVSSVGRYCSTSFSCIMQSCICTWLNMIYGFFFRFLMFFFHAL